MDYVPMLVGTGIALLAFFIIRSNQAAYRLGVNDGYMYSKDPTCPGYAKAGRILKSYGKI